MRKLLTLLFLSIFSQVVFSQFEAQLSQYMFNAAAFNPAATSETEMINVVGQHRMSWIGIPGAGQTTAFNINSPFKIAHTRHSAGFCFLNDIWGGFKNQSIHAQYGYKMKIGKKGTLTLGTEIGFVSVGFSGDSIANHPITIGEYHDMNGDPAIPTTAVNGMQFDAGLGAWFQAEKWYTGVSYRHLTNPTVKWGTQYTFTQYGVLYATGGYKYSQPESNIVWKPSTLLKTDLSTWALDLSLRAEYDDKFWGGISYRLGDAVVIFAGIEIMSGLSVGYSVDVATSKLITANYGSHELMLAYSFSFVKGGKNKHKSIRFL